MGFRPLIRNQHIIIDNHHPGTHMKWDWGNGEKPDDIHLDKSLSRKVNGKKVSIKISLNNDVNYNGPKKVEEKDKEWISAYNKMKEEVIVVLSKNPKAKEQLIEDLVVNIREIGPNKEARAIRKALIRISRYFDFEEKELIGTFNFIRGTANLYYSDNVKYYVGFGNDYAFYLGQGNGADFSKRIHRSKI